MRNKLLIVLVESDDLILQLLERWLAQAGHLTRAIDVTVIRATDPIDLIVADAPGTAAAAGVVAALRAAHDAPVLLISARFPQGARRSAALARQLGVEALLPKPFTRDQFLAAVATALGSGAAGGP